MNAVNLLPAKHRPRQATGGRSGSSYAVLGTLAAIVIAVLVYVMSVSSINDSKTKIADAHAEAVRANAEADSLGAYGNFAKVKQDRVTRVKQLADGRVDWERVLREVAHLLPNGVWITTVDAADTPTDSSATASASTASAGTTAAAPGPQITLDGCAPSQPTVADTIVRLRHLDGASDVQLDHSARPADGSTSSSSSSSSSGSDGCGTTHGKTNYEFEVKVSLETPKPADDSTSNVPASLGGGQ